MPRVANPPRANGRSKHGAAVATPLGKTQFSIPLNDDAQEKAVRLQSRQALHDLQLNQLKAAASPMRRLDNYNRAASNSPKTPRGTHSVRPKENESDGLPAVAGSMVSPVKRVPLLANFEEWMKMATDNKINATNSWNFALIDYFHDMSLLKEGDGVNFQKASCTLDGCVKIYTSRVDSVATETGKLLSGLADSGNKKRKGDEEEDAEGEEGDEEEEGEDGAKRKTRKRTQRSSEATLAPSFSSLQLKKFELEFSVDPLFKKASADFDEGGAKGLLLNHLAIDGQGRIVFDSSDDAGDATKENDSRRRKSAALEDIEETDEDDETRRSEEPEEQEPNPEQDEEVDVFALGAKYFPNLALLEEQDICPSLKNFDLGDVNGSADIPFLKAPEDWRQERHQQDDPMNRSGIFLDDESPAGFDDDDGALGGFDLPADTGFGEGGDAWARDAAIEPQMRVQGSGYDEEKDGEEMGVGEYDPNSAEYGIILRQGPDREGGHENILSYFDEALKKQWAGPEHWRIRKIKDNAQNATSTTRTRKEKEPFEIDFLAPLDPAVAEAICTPASSNSVISLPKAQWKSKTRNLLPDDKHFNSRQLLSLFLKPKARVGSRQRALGEPHSIKGSSREYAELPEGEMDEAFWAQKGEPISNEEGMEGNYDANFFQDDGLAFPGGLPDDDNDDDFADARDHFSPGLEGAGDGAGGMHGLAEALASTGQEGAFGTQLVTQSRRLRPEYVQYARVAKKVDVRRLKEEMWKGMDIANHEAEQLPVESPLEEASPVLTPKADQRPLKFTSVMNDLQAVYPKQAMADISTSYCFICLLHLANEKGLAIESEESLVELNIRKDASAVIEGEA